MIRHFFFCHSIIGWVYLSGLFEVQVTETGLRTMKFIYNFKVWGFTGSRYSWVWWGKSCQELLSLAFLFSGFILRQVLFTQLSLAPPGLYRYQLSSSSRGKRLTFPTSSAESWIDYWTDSGHLSILTYGQGGWGGGQGLNDPGLDCAVESSPSLSLTFSDFAEDPRPPRPQCMGVTILQQGNSCFLNFVFFYNN